MMQEKRIPPPIKIEPLSCGEESQDSHTRHSKVRSAGETNCLPKSGRVGGLVFAGVGEEWYEHSSLKVLGEKKSDALAFRKWVTGGRSIKSILSSI